MYTKKVYYILALWKVRRSFRFTESVSFGDSKPDPPKIQIDPSPSTIEWECLAVGASSSFISCHFLVPLTNGIKLERRYGKLKLTKRVEAEVSKGRFRRLTSMDDHEISQYHSTMTSPPCWCSCWNRFPFRHS